MNAGGWEEQAKQEAEDRDKKPMEPFSGAAPLTQMWGRQI